MTTFLAIALIAAGAALALLAGLVYFAQLMAAHNGGHPFKGAFTVAVIAGSALMAGMWLLWAA